MVKKRKYKPKNDNEFLSDIAFIVFVVGFNFRVVNSKWPNIKKAFSSFNIAKLSKYTAKDVDKLMKAKDMIKNRGKIEAIIENARICAELKKQHGTVLKWIAKVRSTHKRKPLFEPTLQEEFQRFNRIGKETSGWLASLHNSQKTYVEYDVPGT